MAGYNQTKEKPDPHKVVTIEVASTSQTSFVNQLALGAVFSLVFAILMTRGESLVSQLRGIGCGLILVLGTLYSVGQEILRSRQRSER